MKKSIRAVLAGVVLLVAAGCSDPTTDTPEQTPAVKTYTYYNPESLNRFNPVPGVLDMMSSFFR
ncbi:hypothetical protein [Brevibacillus dissolubilis]|uniref:hypothetical protein n=1 Tax=Brevibacillus dissolubilis TaxID=1844116 RepID=UPI00111655B0|nr:hypothetical protein [Brevibacillus dissolubilis]